jgi:uncharacterized RDD family membrane protein YckC
MRVFWQLKMNTSYRYAGFYPRLLAHNIDLVLMLPVFYGLSALIDNNRILYPACMLTYLAYHLIFEWLPWKATPGKKLQRMQIVHLRSKNPAWSIFLRNLCKPLSVLPFFAGILMMLFDKQKRTLHDRIAGTSIIFEDF